MAGMAKSPYHEIAQEIMGAPQVGPNGMPISDTTPAVDDRMRRITDTMRSQSPVDKNSPLHAQGEGGDSWHQEKIFRMIDDIGPDEFYGMPGAQAFEAVKMRSSPELLAMWDRMPVEGRVKLMDAMIYDFMSSPEDIMNQMNQQQQPPQR